MTNYKATIQRLTYEGGNIRENITYNNLLELEAALNEAHEQMPEGDEHDEHIREQWHTIAGRKRFYSCFIAEIDRRKEQANAEAQNEQLTEMTRTFSNNSIQSDGIIEELEEARARVRRESDPEQSQHCRHCINLMARINELERRLNILEARNIQQESELIAQIQQAPPAYSN